MSILIKNIHCIKALVNRNPEMVISLKADSKKDSEIIALAESRNIQIDLTTNGMSAVCKEPPIKDIKSQGYELGNMVLIMDEIQDTRNLGSCLRSASFFGVNSVVIPKNNSADFSNPAVIETSTGGIYDLDLYKATNIATLQENLKKNGYWISGFSEHAEISLEKQNLQKKMFLILGNKEKGIRKAR
jgi:rRNA methylases